MNPTDFLVFVCFLTAIVCIARIAMTLIANRHAYKMAQFAQTKVGPEADRTIHILSHENDRLTGQVSRLEDRIAVLERIATDPAIQTHRAIEALR